MLVNKDAYHRETLAERPVRLPLIESATGAQILSTTLEDYPKATPYYSLHLDVKHLTQGRNTQQGSNSQPSDHEACLVLK